MISLHCKTEVNTVFTTFIVVQLASGNNHICDEPRYIHQDIVVYIAEKGFIIQKSPLAVHTEDTQISMFIYSSFQIILYFAE